MNDVYTQALEGAALFDLSGSGLIELAVKDARLFLHNLCTNDVKDLPVGDGCEAFLCTVKARVVAHIFVNHVGMAGQESVWIDFDAGISDKVYKHLDHHLISERVELVDHTAEFGFLRLCGPQVRTKVLGGPVPDLPALQNSPFDPSRRSVRMRSQPCLELPCYDFFGPTIELQNLRGEFAAKGPIAGDLATHEILRVEAGWPAYGVDMDENRFVVEVGRTRQAISYTKGCYLGQEPIVMARDRGHVNRTLLGVKVATGDVLARGVRLFQGNDEVGQVTSSVISPRLGVIGLAYLKRGSQEPGTALTIEPATDGRQAVVAPLPFGVT